MARHAGRGGPRIVILGAGFGGLECASSLRWLLPGARITVMARDNRFFCRPASVYVPFGMDPWRTLHRADIAARRRDVEFIRARVRDIDTDRQVVSADSLSVTYDYLVVATGSAACPHEIRGLADNGISVGTLGEMIRLRQELHRIATEAGSGRSRRVLFLATAGNGWPAPLYELAMMLDPWLRSQALRGNVDVTVATSEKEFLQTCGSEMSSRIGDEFARRGVNVRTSARPRRVDGSAERSGSGTVLFHRGKRLAYDLLVCMPPQIGAARFESLPLGPRDFVQADPMTCRVAGLSNVFALGDAGDYEVKQGFAATRQADVVAANMASEINGDYPSEAVTPGSIYVMDQLDSATYVQSGNGAAGQVNSNPIWRAGKRAALAWTANRLSSLKPLRSEWLETSGHLAARLLSAVRWQGPPAFPPVNPSIPSTGTIRQFGDNCSGGRGHGFSRLRQGATARNHTERHD